MANYYDNEKFFNGYMSIRSQKMNYNNCIEEPLMLKLIGNTEGKDILDIGCGSGELSSILAKTANSVLGIDISQKMLNTAREKNISNNIRYQELSMENIGSLSEKFDIAVSSLAFHYVENFEKLILDIFCSLRVWVSHKGMALATLISIRLCPGCKRVFPYAPLVRHRS